MPQLRSRAPVSVLGIDRHALNFETSNMLSRAAGMLEPRQILEVLSDADIEYVLVGAHGISGWTGAPRATQDVDVVVKQGQHKKAIKAVLGAFPHLKIKDLPVVTRVYIPETEQVVLGLMKPTDAVCKAALKHCQSMGDYRIPTLSMAIVMKFAAMVSAFRSLEKNTATLPISSSWSKTMQSRSTERSSTNSVRSFIQARVKSSSSSWTTPWPVAG